MAASEDLFKIIQVLVERFFQRGQRKERGDYADGTDREGATSEVEILTEELEQQGDGDYHTPHEIGNRSGYSRSQIRAELFGGYGHEDGSVADGEFEHKTHAVEKLRAPAPLQKVEGHGGNSQKYIEEDHFFPALQYLAQEAARKVTQDQPEVAEHDRVPGGDRLGRTERFRKLRRRGVK